jgi:CHAT domain-containing protein
VLFGDGSKATISDISEWNLKDVNLFVLSACQTGLGTSANGAEILGFGYQVQRAGAKASIATLWKVSDVGTEKLMDAFYTAVKTGKVSNVEALRQAQVAMITDNYEG